MASTPDQRAELKMVIGDLRRYHELTLEQIADALKARGFPASTSKIGGWANGDYAPSSRALAQALDEILGNTRRVLQALGYEPRYAYEPPDQNYIELDIPPDFHMRFALVDMQPDDVEEMLDLLNEMVDLGRGTAAWTGPVPPPPRVAAALARFALSDANFAQAAHKGATESQEGTVDKPPATSGFDPDEP